MFTNKLPDIERAIFSTKTSAQLAGKTSVKCACGQSALFQCPECGVSDMVCAQCLVKMHPNHRLHHVERWDGLGWVRTSLFKWEHQVHLGHGGAPCPNASGPSTAQPSTATKAATNKTGGGRTTVIVDTNGIHQARIFYCHCGLVPTEDYLQLLAARLFPATVEIPYTAFTFDVLDNFHVHTLTSKKTALDYYRGLQKLTDGAFPEAVPYRYREFLRVVRVWRHVTIRRRSGQPQEIDKLLPNRRPGSLGVRCPTCLEVGFNVDKALVYSPNFELRRHLYTLFLSSDGNFKLQRKRKVDDHDDVALNGGNAYFLEDSKYRQYISEIGPADDKCTCSKLKAVRMQNIAKLKSSVISGVVAVQCARHGFFMPGGMVDLKKGEGYTDTDYALGHALGDAHDQRWIVLTYDVYCQYFKSLTSRFGRWFPSLTGLIKRLSGAVPKMHIRNHVAQCNTQWSTNFTEFLAFLIGKLIEGLWAELNQFAGSTKEMNHGHRHDTLDDGCGQWNWDKVIGMGQTLLKMYREACAAVRKRLLPFEQLTAATNPELIAKWSTMKKTWEIKDGEYRSPYQANLKDGPPTHHSAYKKLITEELKKSLAQSNPCTGKTEFISRGLRIEIEHRWHRTRIPTILKTSVVNKAVEAKASLCKEMTAWRIKQYEMFPGLQSDIWAQSAIPIEKQKLFLPSSLDKARRKELGMEELVNIESELREGQAHDALADVWIAIKTFNFNVAFKIANIMGQAANTRAQNFLQTLANDRIRAADKYRIARKALLGLGMSDSDPTLQHLTNEELYAKNTRDSPKMGESGDVDPWFWTVGRPAGLGEVEQKAWSTERMYTYLPHTRRC
ncbi:hypothetical protein B0H19DRAFT_1345812 [Mycena capillaripes]|nr:hypothetical protein B0H19DRAFT_1345812 [Mycena capillaripes]